MPERFHGPWFVTVERTSADPPYAFSVQGSENADSLYAADPANPPWAIEVRGEAWIIDLKRHLDGQWESTPHIRRYTSSEPADGLVVRLDFHQSLTLKCVCRDPAVNPEPSPQRYDFTIPGG